MSDKEVLTKYMEIIDSLKHAHAHAKSIDGSLAVSIENVIPFAVLSASRVSYRIQRETWESSSDSDTYESRGREDSNGN